MKNICRPKGGYWEQAIDLSRAGAKGGGCAAGSRGSGRSLAHLRGQRCPAAVPLPDEA